MRTGGTDGIIRIADTRLPLKNRVGFCSVKTRRGIQKKNAYILQKVCERVKCEMMTHAQKVQDELTLRDTQPLNTKLPNTEYLLSGYEDGQMFTVGRRLIPPL